MKHSLDLSYFLDEISSLSLLFYCLPLFFFFCIVHLKRTSHLSLLFSGTLHSVWFIFPFLPCLLLLFFPYLFVKPPQTITLPSCISFSWGWFWSLPAVQCDKPPSIVLQALYHIYSLESICHLLNLFVTSTV